MTAQEFKDKLSELIFVELEDVKNIIEKAEGDNIKLSIIFNNNDIFNIIISK